MNRPLIGIECGTSALDSHAKISQDRLNRSYSRAVWEAGGVPVIVPCLEDSAAAEAIMSRLDGLLLSGGADVSPTLYGEDRLNDTVEVDEARDRAGQALIRAALRNGLPVFAICRGIQALNVAMGGTLYQDLPAQRPSEIRHRQTESRGAQTHSIEIDPESRLARIVGATRMEVNSFHHQAIKDVAEGLTVTARAPDGVVEAVEGLSGSFLLGVQFHPEELIDVCEGSRALFRALAHAAEGARVQTR